jgi:hypothetical protein
VPVISIGSHATASRGPAGSRPIPSAMMVAPVKPPANPDSTFLTTLFASVTCPSIQIAAFTAHTKAIMVTMAAASAAHHGFALQRRTRMKTRAANGIATSAMRKSPGAPLILSISGTNNGVRTPDSTPPAATFSRPLRDASVEAIAWVNVHSRYCCRARRLERIPLG